MAAISISVIAGCPFLRMFISQPNILKAASPSLHREKHGSYGDRLRPRAKTRGSARGPPSQPGFTDGLVRPAVVSSASINLERCDRCIHGERRRRCCSSTISAHLFICGTDSLSRLTFCAIAGDGLRKPDHAHLIASDLYWPRYLMLADEIACQSRFAEIGST